MNIEFGYNTALIKRVAKTQVLIDKEFASDVVNTRRKLFQHKISGSEFWEQYKKALLKSVGKNKKTVQAMFSKVDKEMKKRFKEAEKEEKEAPEKTKFPDLSLPG